MSERDTLCSVQLRIAIIIYLEHSLPFLRNLIGQFQGAKSLSSPQHSCPLLRNPLLICPVSQGMLQTCYVVAMRAVTLIPYLYSKVTKVKSNNSYIVIINNKC